MNNNVQFPALVASCSEKWGTGKVVISIKTSFKHISQDDRENIGAWAAMETPTVDLVIDHPEGIALEMEGEITGARADMVNRVFVATVKVDRAEIDAKTEQVLADLVRFSRKCNMEIKAKQMSF